jgi:predicted transglutaminase-like cysteine proteinase
MRRLVKIAAAASVLGTAFFGTAEAAFIGMPMNLGVQLEHGRFETPTLAPMAHPDDCKARKIVFRSSRVRLTPQRVQDLMAVDTAVNSSIEPQRNDAGIAGERWLVAPPSEIAMIAP